MYIFVYKLVSQSKCVWPKPLFFSLKINQHLSHMNTSLKKNYTLRLIQIFQFLGPNYFFLYADIVSDECALYKLFTKLHVPKWCIKTAIFDKIDLINTVDGQFIFQVGTPDVNENKEETVFKVQGQGYNTI